MVRSIAASVGAVVLVSGCGFVDRLPAGCPTRVDEAAKMDFGDAIVAGGAVVRFVPSPQLEFRGYDINVTRPVSDRARMDTYFLLVPEEIDGIAPGDPVLLIGARTDRAAALVPGVCPPLTVTSEEDAGVQTTLP